MTAKIMLHQDVMVKIIVPCHNCSPFVLLFLGRDVLDGVDLLAALGVGNLTMTVLRRASVLVVGTLVLAGPTVGRASVLVVGTLVIAGPVGRTSVLVVGTLVIAGPVGRASVLVVGTLVIAGPVGRTSVLGVGTLVIAGLDRASVET
jgi:hypothetical protein